MPRRPYVMHYLCHIEHVRMWPKYAKVWVAWGTMGWRPGIVFGHRENRVAVRVTDGLWPFDGSRLSGRPHKLTFKAPSSLRVRRDNIRPKERATNIAPCIDRVP